MDRTRMEKLEDPQSQLTISQVEELRNKIRFFRQNIVLVMQSRIDKLENILSEELKNNLSKKEKADQKKIELLRSRIKELKLNQELIYNMRDLNSYDNNQKENRKAREKIAEYQKGVDLKCLL